MKPKKPKLKRVKVADIKPGPIRHPELPPEILARIQDVYERVRWGGVTTSLEQFEIGFMRDGTPEREVRIWECIADAYEEGVNSLKNTPTPNDRKKLLGDILAMTTGAYPEKQVMASPYLKTLAIYYVEAKKKRGYIKDGGNAGNASHSD